MPTHDSLSTLWGGRADALKAATKSDNVLSIDKTSVKDGKSKDSKRILEEDDLNDPMIFLEDN